MPQRSLQRQSLFNFHSHSQTAIQPDLNLHFFARLTLITPFDVDAPADSTDPGDPYRPLALRLPRLREHGCHDSLRLHRCGAANPRDKYKLRAVAMRLAWRVNCQHVLDTQQRQLADEHYKPDCPHVTSCVQIFAVIGILITKMM